MSLKENVDYIKQEIGTEEKFLEGFVKFERIYKKYKFVIISSCVSIALLVVGVYTKDYLDNENKLKANEAYNKLLSDPANTVALATLKDTNIELYNIVTSKGESKVQMPYLKELAAYSKAMEESNIKALDTLIMNPEFILKEYAIFNKALLQAKNGDYVSAKETLKLISKDSQVAKLSDSLKHYLITK